MASLYDYGVPNAVNSMVNLLDVVSQDKARKEQANHNRILQQKAMFEMDRQRKQEEMLDKDVAFTGMLEAQGASPRVIQRTLKYLQGSGLGDEIGRIKVRNIPTAISMFKGDTNYQIGVLHDHLDDIGEQELALEDEITKMKEKPDPEKQQELAQKIMQRESLKAKKLSYNNMLGKLTGVKTDTSLTEAEILSRGGEAAETYIKNKNRLQKDEAAKMQSEIGKLQADRNYYIEQGYTANDPLIQAIDNKIKTSSGMEQTQNQKEMSDLRKETQEFKIQQKRAEAKNAYDGMDLSMDRMIQQAEGLKNSKALPKITGVMGMIPDYPGSEASYARAQQRNLISMMRMDTMTTLRAMSKTGGLVGNVSDAEGKVFETYIANLENKIGTEDFKTELQKVIDYSKGIKTKLANAYKTQFPAEGGDSDDTPPPGFKNTGKHYNGKEVWTKGAESWVKP